MPKEIKSDNGPPFNSHKFEEYAKEEGFKHRKVTPGWAEANGDVERFMQRIKKTARIASLEGKPVRDEVNRGIRAYRATEHATTGLESARTGSCSEGNYVESSLKSRDSLNIGMTR